MAFLPVRSSSTFSTVCPVVLARLTSFTEPCPPSTLSPLVQLTLQSVPSLAPCTVHPNVLCSKLNCRHQMHRQGPLLPNHFSRKRLRRRPWPASANDWIRLRTRRTRQHPNRLEKRERGQRKRRPTGRASTAKRRTSPVTTVRATVAYDFIQADISRCH